MVLILRKNTGKNTSILNPQFAKPNSCARIEPGATNEEHVEKVKMF